MKKEIYQRFSLSYLLTKTARAVLKQYDQEESDLDISPLQGGILFVVHNQAPINQKEIAEILFIDKVTLSKMIVKLEKLEMIKEVKTDNRRSKFWDITKVGKEVLGKINSIDLKVNKKLSKILKDSSLSEEELSILLKALLNSL